MSSKMDSDHQLSQFLKSLQELKELRSQLHNAAAYCEKSFLKSNDKKKILESTKEYVCSAVVTVVDHLGSVSANLNITISDNATGFSEAELRIDSLKQRFLAYELYAQKIALTRTRWSPNFPKSQPRYLSTPAGKSNRCNKKVMFEAAEELPLFFYTYSHKPSSTNSNLSIVPVQDTITAGAKGQRASTFDFQQSSIHQHQQQQQQQQQKKKNSGTGRSSGSRSGSNGDIMSLVRRSKTAIFKA